jgi:NAD(P)-dependent dehydrogenase (short-subunit alcohol dehydrogenase family)
MERVFITGASRGIGLELTRQYAARGEIQVFAAVRNPQKAGALQALPGKIEIVPLEVTDAQSIRDAVRLVSQKTDSLDILINNAGIEPEGQSFERITPETMLYTYMVNSVAPLMISKAFVDLLAKGNNPRLINISSEMGSIEARDYGGSYAYCASKAALNMITRGLAADLRSRKISAVVLDPGWVQTDMGGRSASLKPEESVRGILKVIDGLSMKQSSSFLRWDGGSHEW